MSLSNSSQLMTANYREDDLVVNQTFLNDKRITPKGSHIEIFVDCIDCRSKLKA